MILDHSRLCDTPALLRPAEEKVANTLGATLLVWCGRAATGLYWAYRVAQQCGRPVRRAEIILPSIACASPAATALAAGCRPRFADVDPSTGMLTLETVRDRCCEATRAVVFIHLYGQTADLRPLAAWLRDRDIVLVEDVAQAHGAVLPDGSPAGSVGDMSVYSFNRTKILECGGGLLAIRRDRYAKFLMDLVDGGPRGEIDSQTAAELALSYRNLYHALVTLRRTRTANDIAGAFLPMQDAYSGLYTRSLEDAGVIAAAWPTIARVIRKRAATAAIYSTALAGGPWQCLDGWRSSGVCWRYSLLPNSSKGSQNLTELVRRDGFRVSNLYWPLNDLFGPEDSCPAAELFARRVMNLWVDDTVTSEEAAACCRSLWRHAKVLEGENLERQGPDS